jgi:hypothetical protein
MNTEIRDWPHFAMEMLSIILLIGCFVPLIAFDVPDGAQVPMHFDIDGTPNQVGPAKDLVWLPIMSLLIFVVMTLTEKFPKMINTPRKLSENGREFIRVHGWKFTRELKLCFTAMMCYMCYWMFAVAAGKAETMPVWGFIVCIGAMLIVTIRFYYLLYNYN